MTNNEVFKTNEDRFFPPNFVLHPENSVRILNKLDVDIQDHYCLDKLSRSIMVLETCLPLVESPGRPINTVSSAVSNYVHIVEIAHRRIIRPSRELGLNGNNGKETFIDTILQGLTRAQVEPGFPPTGLFLSLSSFVVPVSIFSVSRCLWVGGKEARGGFDIPDLSQSKGAAASLCHFYLDFCPVCLGSNGKTTLSKVAHLGLCVKPSKNTRELLVQSAEAIQRAELGLKWTSYCYEGEGEAE